MRNIFLFLILLAGYWALRELLRREPGPGPAPSGGGEEMVQDPVCGVYLPAHMALKRKVGGQELYFCSARCESGYFTPETRPRAAQREDTDED